MTHSPWSAPPFLLASAASLILAGLFTWAGAAAAQTQASAASCKTWTIGSAKNPGSVSDDLFAVAALSPSSVWAVGTVRTLVTPTAGFIMHWTGSKWIKAPAINAGATWGLFGVAADSASDVWAVGSVSQNPQFTNEKTLVLHCG
jgi:hypothetical protein